MLNNRYVLNAVLSLEKRGREYCIQHEVFMKVRRVWNAADSENAEVLDASEAAMDEPWQVLRMTIAQFPCAMLRCGC